LQTQADSAAIAAGLELTACSNATCSTMTTAAKASLVEDGVATTPTVTTGSTSSCASPAVSSSAPLAIAINVAPCYLGTTDLNYGNTAVAEVVIAKYQPTMFGAVAGINSMKLVAHAEAGDTYIIIPGSGSTSGGNCVYTKSLEYNSSATLKLTGCSTYDNGSLQTNDTDSMTAVSFLYYGTWSPNNCNSSCTWTLSSGETGPTHTTTAQTDPLASLTAPSKPSTTYTSQSYNSGTTTISPGAYSGDLNLNSGVTVNLSPGLYYFDGSINVNSGATLECTSCSVGGQGVTLYFDSGHLQANSGSTIELDAPTSGYTSNGDIANMLLWGGSGASDMEVDSNSSSYLNGIVYLPYNKLTLNSGSSVTMNNTATATVLDVKDLMLDSGEDFVIKGSGGYLGGGTSSGTSTKLLGKFVLAE
jgi:hypothetical protein